MIVPRQPERLVTIGQIGTEQSQIVGIAHRPERHFRKGFAHVDYSNARTVMIFGDSLFNTKSLSRAGCVDLNRFQAFHRIWRLLHHPNN